MKVMLYFALFLFIGYSGYTQDTTEFIRYYDGSKSFKLSTIKDTSIIYIYPDGKRESVHQIKRDEKQDIIADGMKMVN